MSVAGLLFQREGNKQTAPLETKSGSYIYAGDPASFHDWAFRTQIRISLYEESAAAAAKKAAAPESPKPSAAASPTRVSAEARVPREDEEVSEEEPPSESPKSQQGEGAEQRIRELRSSLVHRVIEGLRGDAFLVARDLGLEALTAPGGLQLLVDTVKKTVFPRATEEGRELFRVGQRPGGPLSRQQGESMVSYTSRRRRWWRTLKELDPDIDLSESMRSELMLELSGISQQEILVVKACAPDGGKTFDGIAQVLVNNYGGVHLREGRALGARQPYTPKGSSKGSQKGTSKGKWQPQWRQANVAWEDEAAEPDSPYHDYEDYEYGNVACFAGDDDPEMIPDNPQFYDPYDYEIEAETEEEAVALNALESFNETGVEDEAAAGHAIQLELSALAAFQKASGKGKGSKGKGKGKGKGKLVRSNLSLDQRRQSLADLKSKSRCLRCGGQGHWAGDPSCKFPGPRKPDQGQSKPVANYVDMSDSSDDLEPFLDVSAAMPSLPEQEATGYVVRATGPRSTPKSQAAPAKAAPAKAAPARPDVAMAPPGGDRRMVFGQYINKTYHWVVTNHPEYCTWGLTQTQPSRQLQDFLTWAQRYYIIEVERGVSQAMLRSDAGIPEGAYQPRPRHKGAQKEPPVPPLPEKCHNCIDFSYKGSTAYRVRKTCKDCGHKFSEERELQYTHRYEECPHEIVDHRGSSRTTSRIFCKQCGNFIDERPMADLKVAAEAGRALKKAPVEVSRMVEEVLASPPAPTRHRSMEGCKNNF